MEDAEKPREDPGQTPDLIGRIEGVESNIKNLDENVRKTSSDLNDTVTMLKDAIVEIRLAISEIENPFNILRSITSENDVRKLEEAKGSLKVVKVESPQQNEVESPLKEAAFNAPVNEENREPSEIADAPIQTDSRSEQVSQKISSEIHGGKPSLTILKWIWSLLDLGLDIEDVNRISDYCEHLNYLEPDSGRIIARLAPVVQKSRTKGVSMEELVLNIFGAATASGIEVDPHDLKEAIFNAMKLTSSPRCR